MTKMRYLRALLLIAAAMCCANPVWAQNNWSTPGGAQANGVVLMCLNAQGLAVPTDQSGACPGGSSGGGTSSAFAAAFPASGTAIGVKNGANMVNLTADGSSNLNINCAVGCAGGTTSNAGSAVATSGTNGASVSYLYGFNGTTWDQLQVDGGKRLVVTGSGGTFPVTGTFFQATQPVSAASLPLPTGAATSALQTTINTTLGNPFQAGGSIGNTGFIANAGTNLNTSTLSTSATQGTTSDAPCTVPTTTAACSQVAIAKANVNAVNSGTVNLGQAAKSLSVPVTMATDQYIDPCMDGTQAKSSVAINISSATTTNLVALSGSTTIYACGFSFTINQEITTADTLQFEYGTGATCGTGTVALTGLFGAGGISAGIPVLVTSPPIPAYVFKTAASNGLCVVTAGTTPSFQGFLTYVQK